jgi:hypothetical protein
MSVGERLKGSIKISDQSLLKHKNTRMAKINLWISENN